LNALSLISALEKSAAWLGLADDADARAVEAAIREWLDRGAIDPLDKALAISRAAEKISPT
jgi:hypothetical protein